MRPIPAANPRNRFAANVVEYFDDASLGGAREVELSIYEDHTKQVLAANDSPDLGFRYSINPYRGCFHGCAYCLSGETRILMADGGCGWRFERFSVPSLVLGPQGLVALAGDGLNLRWGPGRPVLLHR